MDTTGARTDAHSPWFRRQGTGRPRLRLVCFPHAGGAATAYADWPSGLPEGVELLAVQYPGRQDRLAEPCADSLAGLAEAVTTALLPHLGLPVALFGHSMGSAVAYEVALRLRRAADTEPVALLVSGRRAPHLGGRVPVRLDDAGLLESVRRLSSPDAWAYDHPDLREVLMPSLRGDHRLLDAYRPDPPAERLRVPVTVYGGDDDPVCPVADLDTWAQVTDAGHETVVLPGGHFFLRERQAALLAHLSSRLAPHLGGP
ncbi:thioesterase II family protein [Streptomyces abyssomicinicus]|uniref:thioesterase II family protein n=1 Tax=Streptomyces abyssomicinicus TaxID=574929 RepID=UPI0012500E81|nr:alpha/beta fold hydrolase [Streptomyces abyssomicinicus]